LYQCQPVPSWEARGTKRDKAAFLADKAIIESLKPWKDGNGLLYALHEIDKTRKHRRLVEITSVPTFTTLWPWGRPGGLEFPTPDQWTGFKNDTVLAWISIDAPNYQIEFTLNVAINEPGLIAGPSVITKLHDFASLANSIISLFDS
jgi:hypothetical protein